ncbi:MAG: zinc ribbon domain-containing protein [Acidobacteria bacterium]|nr:zinc ribbon domain-containing protein [Acidobacteriota bacterium]
MAAIHCPKCGFEQDEGAECPRCGIIFSRMRASASITPPDPIPESRGDSSPPATGRLRRYYRMFRWAGLVVFVSAAALILCDSSPPRVEIPRNAIEQAEVKVRQFRSGMQQGRKGELELDQPELNGWLQTNLAIGNPGVAEPVRFPQGEAGAETIGAGLKQYEIDEEELEKAKSSIRDLRVELLQDTVRLYALFETHGIDLSLEIEGRLRAEDGYLKMDPVGGRLGSLPLPPATLRSAVDKVFESRENREKFKLPAGIRDMRIDRGRLVVSSQ